MASGISVYLGLDYSLEANLEYIKAAKDAGFSRIFTSLHIPETNHQQLLAEFKTMITYANSLNMMVIADISPDGYHYLGIQNGDLTKLKQFGIAGLRLDYGFHPKLIAEYTRNDCGLLIELNASTMTEKFMAEIISCQPKLTNLSACHNYYPRKNTGISLSSLMRKNKLFHDYGIPVSAFVGLPTNRRAPLYEGLPTVESTRELHPLITWQILSQTGIDHIFIGDSLANSSLLEQISHLKTGEVLLLCDEFDSKYAYLLDITHTNRPDSAADVVRSQESRLCLLENINLRHQVIPENCCERKIGSVTVDNINYLRYSGEMQICRCDLESDERVNVIGKLTMDSRLLLPYIDDDCKFRLMKI